jgi:hypothetical protein
MKSKTDSHGRKWNYSDADGSWIHGKHIIGCGVKNGSKWQIWNGPDTGHYEYRTLSLAMSACR